MGIVNLKFILKIKNYLDFFFCNHSFLLQKKKKKINTDFLNKIKSLNFIWTLSF